jgi:hypothetical protein
MKYGFLILKTNNAMKKIRLLIALVCYMLSFFSAEAKRVDVEKAEKVARSHARSTSRLLVHKDFRLSKTVVKRITRPHPAVRSADVRRQDEPMYYVFTTNENGGFIIVSGDDVAKPVLGYSDDGTYDESNPNFAYWMETLSREIAAAVENGVSQDEQTEAAWDAFENNKPVRAYGDYVEPLIKTRWTQHEPYNNLCPKISGTRTLTGCVATAMAQIMKYHKYPKTRTVEIPGYTTGTGINIPAISGSTTYEWDNMSNTYTSSSSGVSTNAVAELMYHCGVSVRMDYGIEGSGAYSSNVPITLNTYFGYDAGISYLMRFYYSNTEWRNLLKMEIIAGRPVYYSGQNDEAGHAFVCDGYDINDLFHFNWGWGGYSDGYFEVSALNPDGFESGFNQDQMIITGIQPENGQSDIQLELSSLKITGNLYQNGTGNFEAEITNNGTGDYNSNLTLKLGTHTITNPVVISAKTTKTVRFSATITLLPGDYSLSVWYDPSNTANGNPSMQLGNDISAEVKAEQTVQTPDITVQPQPAVYTFDATATALSVTANVTDGGTLSYQWYGNTIDDNIGGEKINGATSASYTPPTATIGTIYYYVLVTNADTDENIAGLRTAAATSSTAAITVNKASQPAPAAPALADKTATSVTLNTISDNTEYGIDGGNWQPSPVFDGLAPNTTYTFYARMKETGTHNASQASEGLSVVTYAGTDADLLSLTVNNRPLSVANRESEYMAECGETSVRLDIEMSVAASATVTVNNVVVDNYTVPLSGDSTVININIVSADNKKTNDYRLTVSNPLDADIILFRRWKDIVAVNGNPENNGERDVNGIRWYIDGSTEALSSQYIQITEGEKYRAEINIAGKWHNVCGEPKTHSGTVAAYPNPVPVGENLSLQLPDGFTGGYMDVISLSGSIVKRKLPLPDSSNTISVADWTPGIYLLNIIAPNGDRESVKIIVSN